MEDPDENQDTREITKTRKSPKTMEEVVGRAFAKRNEFLYQELLTQKPVVEVPPLPAKYFRQFQIKDTLSKSKASIEEGIKAENILERMLEGEMTIMLKELWAIAPKLRTTIKEILTSRRTNQEGKETVQELLWKALKSNVIEIA